MTGAIKSCSIHGFKSIRELTDLQLKDLNVIVGANGAGKSNLVQVFKMLMAMEQKRFQTFISQNGGSDGFLYNGPQVTSEITGVFEFDSGHAYARGPNSYGFKLTPTADERFSIEEARKYVTSNWRVYGSGLEESRIRDEKDEADRSGELSGIGHYVHHSISNWIVYHFHDTSSNAPMRRSEIVEDHARLRKDAANIAPYLLHLRSTEALRPKYQQIVQAVRLILPFFDDFRLDVQRFGPAERVKLTWQQKGFDYPMQAYHLSDGSIRFICLATALLQPDSPSTLIIDEPELGLHPEAIRILGELIRSAAEHTQVIIATQSPLLLDQFSINDVIIARRNDGQSTFTRLAEKDFKEWLDDYTIGELWTQNIIQGGTAHE